MKKFMTLLFLLCFTMFAHAGNMGDIRELIMNLEEGQSLTFRRLTL